MILRCGEASLIDLGKKQSDRYFVNFRKTQIDQDTEILYRAVNGNKGWRHSTATRVTCSVYNIA